MTGTDKKSEAQIQSECFRWLWNEHPETRGLFFTINNNSEHVVRAMIRKSLGIVPGVADTVFLWKGNAYFIEFKTNEGVLSKAQIEWHRKIINEMFLYFVVRSVDEFKTVIKYIMGYGTE
jgi:ATP-dependent exoDNAse (exonuclease V) beta subunit